MITLTGFADEISPELDVQLDVLESLGMKHLELRSVWGKNVAHFNKEELKLIKETLDARGFSVSAIGSPIGKIGILDDFEKHKLDFERVIKTAHYLNTSYIRIFSFFIPEGENPTDYREEVLSRMKELVKVAEVEKVVLLHENEKDIYGDNAERCVEILEYCDSPNLRAAFDPANFVQCGVKPFTEAYPLLEKYIEYMHVKDALFTDGEVVPAGNGDGEMKETYQALRLKEYKGFASLEPHLAAAGPFSGFSGPDLFGLASRSFKELLSELEIKVK
ncbi:sugar phosphate isomerase/epimerase family protein [Sutcliffiella halmapala]|uniref:sugar phosphate isomerase/epimerase family protein n=1 Tax=Sutcliffiella halmapala TaxID=79882 RepID=UPI000994AC77|nr:TIM barrel protein [Sutcliffiella halmapala]